MTAEAPAFALTGALDERMASAAGLVLDARHAIALTGAGLSVASGIPPFRGPGGLWTGAVLARLRHHVRRLGTGAAR